MPCRAAPDTRRTGAGCAPGARQRQLLRRGGAIQPGRRQTEHDVC